MIVKMHLILGLIALLVWYSCTLISKLPGITPPYTFDLYYDIITNLRTIIIIDASQHFLILSINIKVSILVQLLEQLRKQQLA
jgi:hypothetical protein